MISRQLDDAVTERLKSEQRDREVIARINTGETVTCQACGFGRLYIDEAQTPSDVWRLGTPGAMPHVETVLRRATVLACNACEFIREVVR